MHSLDIAHLCETPPQKHSGMARVHMFSRDLTAFSAIAGTHIQTPEGWKAEFTYLGVWLRSKTVYLLKPIPLLTGLNVEQLEMNALPLNCHTLCTLLSSVLVFRVFINQVLHLWLMKQLQ